MESEGVVADTHDYWNTGDTFEPSGSATQEENTFDTAQEQKTLKKKAKLAKRRARKAQKLAADKAASIHGQVYHPDMDDENIHPDGAMVDPANVSDAVDSEAVAKTAKEKRREKAKAKKLRKKKKAKVERIQRFEEKQEKAAQRRADARVKGGYVVYSEDELRSYLRYPYLYGERLYQKPVKRPQNLSFLELPTEIRNMVYHHVLDLDEPIELWPGTKDVYADQKRCRCNAVILERKLCTKRAHNLGLLRTCKQINAEAAVVFYGQNEFRFSGVNGHMATYAFITKIGRQNLKLLKSITIVMPLWIPERGHYGKN